MLAKLGLARLVRRPRSGAIVAAALAALVALAAPAPRAQAQDLGGGFLELLLTGRDPTPQRAAALYAAPPPAAAGPARVAPPVETRRPAPAAPQVAAVRPGGGAIADIYRRQVVGYDGPHAPGTVVVDTRNKFLFLVQEGGTALRYGVGVGREGFSWRGTERITRKAEWPDWRPPAAMRRRQPELPAFMPGGPSNPLGARALYLGDTLYRIHGTNEPGSIGRAMSSGCIRMMNDDVVDLYQRVRVGTRVVVM
ncbi:L,D-transpeptidase [Salinarimonas rosea]|uniref:L,D-transpeptidase n=1 Tax=Salinarimonas rosea TaxID=552063 RepID=UPI0003FF7D08|nr:L,D-transpeptidase [Salinarimonas rosea]